MKVHKNSYQRDLEVTNASGMLVLLLQLLNNEYVPWHIIQISIRNIHNNHDF